MKHDSKYIAEFLRAKRLNSQYKGSNERFEHANEMLKLFSALIGDDFIERMYNEDEINKGGITMCDFIERIKDEGRDEGRNEGFAKAQEELIINLIESNAGTIEQIAAWVKLPVKEVKKIAATVPVEA